MTNFCQGLLRIQVAYEFANAIFFGIVNFFELRRGFLITPVILLYQCRF